MSEHEELAEQIASRLAVRLGPPPERRLWDLEAVAKFLGIAKGTLSNMISDGTFPQHAIKIGTGPASRRWTEKQVTDWVTERMFQPGSPTAHREAETAKAHRG